MESNLNVPDLLNSVPDSLNDDIRSDSFPYFLEPPPVPAYTAFEYVTSPDARPGSERMQGGLGDFPEGTTSYPDPTALLQTQEHIGSTEPYRSEAFVAGIRNGLTDASLDVLIESAYPFTDQAGTQDDIWVFAAHDNLDDPSSVLPGLDSSTSDELTQSPLQESPPTTGVRNENANPRERHRKTNGGYQCDHEQCDKTFDIHRDLKYVAAEKTPMVLAYNSRRHKKQHSRNFICDQCTRPFASQKDLGRHVDNVHNRHRNHICPVCDRGFGRKDNMRRHCRKVHQQDIP